MLSRLLAIPAAVLAIGQMPKTAAAREGWAVGAAQGYNVAPNVYTRWAAPPKMAAAETGAVLPAGDIHLDSYWQGWDARDQAPPPMGAPVTVTFTPPDATVTLAPGIYPMPPDLIHTGWPGNVTIRGAGIGRTTIRHMDPVLDPIQIMGHDFTPPGKLHSDIGCSTCWVIEHQPHVVPTFEAMAADCAARGCGVERADGTYDGDVWYLHTSSGGGYGVTPEPPRLDGSVLMSGYGSLARVDAWRRSLHETY